MKVALMKSSRLLVKSPQQISGLHRGFASASLIGPTPSPASVSFNYRQALGNIPETKITRLSNGVTVATESNSNFKTATVGLWIKAGSRNEAADTNGVAHFLEHMIFKGSAKRSARDLESFIESFGGSLNAYTTREHTAFFAKSLSSDVAASVEALADSVLNPSLSEDAVAQEKKNVLAEIAALDKNKEALVFDHLHGCAFQSSSLGRTVLGSASSLNKITSADLSNFLRTYYSPERLVLVGAGDVSHESLVKLAESHFGSLKSSGTASALTKPTFVGSDVRARFDNYPTAHVAFAVEGAGWTSPDFWPLLVANGIIGKWATSHSSAKHASSKLAQNVQKWNLADSFKTFNIPYSDTGLFGIYAESHNYQHLDDLTHYIQQEWHRLAMTITDVEVFQAKNNLKTAILGSLENTDAVADDIGKQVLAYGKRLSPWEVDGLIESVTANDITKVAGQYVYDKEVAVVGYGPVEALSEMRRLLFCILLTLVNAVKREDFKRCDQSGFCVRQRAYAKLVDLKTPLSDYEVIGSTLHVDKGAGSLSADVLEHSSSVMFKLNIQLLEHNAIRLRMLEKNTTRPRFELMGDLALVDGIQAAKASGASTSADRAKISLGDINVLIEFKPLKLEVLRGDEPIMAFNNGGYLNYEHQRTKEEVSNSEATEDTSQLTDQEKEIINLKKDVMKSMWEESFGGKQDSKPFGPTSIGFDVSFNGIKHLYGIPQHASSFALKSTRGASALYPEPYRLYNFDVFEYELNNPMALYGSIPFIMGHGVDYTAGVLWLNAAEMWVDIELDQSIEGKKGSSKSHWMSESGILDVIFFVTDSPRSTVSSLSHLTGKPIMPQLFAIAYHQCRWNYLDEQDVAEVDSNFDKFDIPYDVLWLDIEHTDGKKYFTWDKLKFPNPKEMQAKLSMKGRKMVTIIDPHIKREDSYSVSKNAQDKDLFVKSSSGEVFEGWCWPGSSNWLDYLNPAAREYWAQLFRFENYEGSTPSLYTWNDMNEPSVFNGPEITMPKDNLHFGGWEHRDVHNLYGALQHRATAEGHLIRSNNQDRPFVLSRAFFIGTQRYGAIWTGDNAARWDHLEASTPMLLSIGISGLSFAGADVGGFFGNPEPDLLVRWYQAGVFQPFFRAHAHIDTKRREPWLFGEPYVSRIRNAVRDRYRLLPYLYTLFFHAHEQGIPVMRPLMFEFPRDQKTFATDDSFMLGNAILVYPIVERDLLSVDVYLPPASIWYDYYTFAPTSGGELKVTTSPNSIPVFLRGGSVVPRRDRIRRASSLTLKDPFTLIVALDAKGKAFGSLYVDDGRSFGYESGSYIYMDFSFDGETLYAKNVRKPKLDGGKPLSQANQSLLGAKVERVIIVGLSVRPQKVTVQGVDSSAAELDSVTEVSGKYYVVIKKPELVSLMTSILFLEGSFSDINVVVLGKTFRLHKVVLLQSPFLSRLMACRREVTDSLTLDIYGDPRITKESVELVFWDLYDPSESGRSSRISQRQLVNVLAAACFFELDDLALYCTSFILASMSESTVLSFAEDLEILQPSGSFIRPTSCGPDHQYHSLLDTHRKELHDAVLSYLCQCVNSELTREDSRQVLSLFDCMPVRWLRRVLECDVLSVQNEFERYCLLKKVVVSRREKLRQQSHLADSPDNKRPSSLFGDYLSVDISNVFGGLSASKKKKYADSSTSAINSSNSTIPPTVIGGMIGSPSRVISSTSASEGVPKSRTQCCPGLLNLYGPLGGGQTDVEVAEDKIIMLLFETGMRYTYMSFSDLEKVKVDRIVPDSSVLQSFWMQAEMMNAGYSTQSYRPSSPPASIETDFGKPFRFSARFHHVNKFFAQTEEITGEKTIISEPTKCAGVDYRVLLCCSEEDAEPDPLRNGPAGTNSKKQMLKAHLQRSRPQTAHSASAANPFVSYNIYVFDVTSFRVEKDRWKSFWKPLTACTFEGEGHIKPFPLPPAIATPEVEGDGDIFLIVNISIQP
ncbi:hypothetical protein HDU67_003018 [Dinochytrium kinnereticum]|nr:hypothetical protein HDU67_003018 [Dinochytrium kinnereticum]